MSDNENVQNHTIRVLQEMRGEMAEFRQEVRQRFDAVDRRFDTLEHRIGVIEPAVLKVIDAATVVAKTQEQHTGLLMAHSEKLTEIHRAQNVMEKDMRGIRGRVERIEDHIGLVKA
jgi:phosphoenolpyruvate-protein kinase (PTS system EI component)